MVDLILPSLQSAATTVSHSALPDAPVIPDPHPGPLRRGTAGALRRLATRLDRDAGAPAGHRSHPAATRSAAA